MKRKYGEDERVGRPALLFVYEVNGLGGKKRSGNTAEAARALAEPAARELGLEVWDVRFLKEGAGWFLRVFIDKPEGVGIEDCERMSRALSPLLDEADPIEQSYCLEVCSPGIDRELTRPEHFARFLGSPVRVRLIRPLDDGRRELCGELVSYADSVMNLRCAGEENRSIARKDASWVRLVEDDFVEGKE